MAVLLVGQRSGRLSTGPRNLRVLGEKVTECVEIANSPTDVAVRDTKAPARATLTFPAGAFSAVLDGVKNYSTVTDFARFRG